MYIIKVDEPHWICSAMIANDDDHDNPMIYKTLEQAREDRDDYAKRFPKTTYTIYELKEV